MDFTTGDDAGVYRLDDHTALVQTVDFFTPVVDDPYAFGEIAAANALSDVYAMGGRPAHRALDRGLPGEGLSRRNGPPRSWRAGRPSSGRPGCALLGGHSVRDPEIKFGYAVTGLVDPEAMMTNAGGRPGDILVLTKPLGTGVLATALKAGEAPEAAIAAATRSMATLNARGRAGGPRARGCARPPTSPGSACSATPRTWRERAG